MSDSAHQNKIPNYLPETPADVDELAGGHQLVADSMSNFILNSDQDIRVIALQGEMGSGKSTILQLVKKRLADTAHFFLFDCFEHQHGPLRYAFLEEFYSFADLALDESSPSSEAIKVAYEEATGRRKKSRVENNTKVSAAAIMLTITLPLSLGATAAFFRFVDQGYSSLVLLAAAVAGLPLTLVGLTWIAHLRDKDWHLSKILTSNNTNEVLELYSVSQDVTSIDVGRCFGTIVGSLPSDKQLVMVFDNLDRVDADSLVSFWGDLEIFARKTSKNVWVIVPFSVTQLARSFASEAGEGAKGTNINRAHEFVNKRFPVRYTVPQLLLSNWKSYLEECWAYVFGSQYEPYVVSDLVQMFGRYGPKGKQPTPRHIKHFVNDVATEISVASIEVDPRIAAVKILFRVDEQGHLLGFMNTFGDGNEEYALRLLESLPCEWQQDLAAIYYGVDGNLAKEVLLYEPMKDAIAARDFEAFEEILQIPSSLSVFSEIMETTILSPDQANTAICLAGVSPEIANDTYKHTLVRALESNSHWDVVQHPYGYADALKSIAEQATESIVKVQWNSLRKRYSNIEEKLGKKTGEVLKNFDALYPLLPKQNKKDTIKIHPTPLFDYWWMAQSSYRNLPLANFLPDLESASNFTHEVISRDESLTIREFLNLMQTADKRGASDMSDVISSAHSRQLGTQVSQRGLTPLEAVMFVFAPTSDVTKVYTALFGDPSIPSIKDEDQDTVRSALLAGCLKNCEVGKLPSNLEPVISGRELDYALIRKLLTIIRGRTCRYFVLTSAHKAINSKESAQLLLKAITELWFPGISLVSMLKSYSMLYELFEESEVHGHEQLYGFVSNWPSQMKDELREDNKVFTDLPADFFAEFLGNDSPFRNELKDHLLRWIDSDLDQDDWESILMSPSAFHQAAVDCLSNRRISSEYLPEAVYSFTESIMANRHPEDREFVKKLISKISSPNLTRLEIRVRQLVYKVGRQGDSLQQLDRLFWLWSDILSQYVPADRAEAEGLERIIGSKRDEGDSFDFLDDWIVHLSKVIRRSDLSDHEEILELILESLKDTSENESLNALRDALE